MENGRWPRAAVLSSDEGAYLSYLAARPWDTPCPRFNHAANELIRRGFARHLLFVLRPLIITEKGIRYLRTSMARYLLDRR